ncbi:MAG: helix-turn-helix transcriptional regulator [Acidobacteria bacterium]|nr:helix-turn-helix transcriptional regulator [Acidobacteriota bacterium]
MTTLEQRINKLGAVRRRKVKARAATLIAEEVSLRDLRRAHKRTQASLAKDLHLTQDQVSRLESRNDLLLSTMRKYVEGLGGSLRLVVEFPDRQPVVLSSFAPVDVKSTPTSRRKQGARTHRS